MEKSLFVFVVLFGLFHGITGIRELCSNLTAINRSCSAQILGSDGSDVQSCTVQYFKTDSSECEDMVFGDLTENRDMGDVKMEPFMYSQRTIRPAMVTNYTALNISFSNIKWNSMKFRFKKDDNVTRRNHCRNILISSNVTVKDQSVLYYDCVWSRQDSNYVGKEYILDFEAEGELGIKRGQFIFTVPTHEILDPNVTISNWKPFIYIENMKTTLKLHIPPAPPQIQVSAYRIDIVKKCSNCLNNDEYESRTTINTHKCNGTVSEIKHQYDVSQRSGSFSFVVTPLHESCPKGVCRSVHSPVIEIANKEPITVICMVGIEVTVVLAVLFGLLLTLLGIRKYWCQDYLRTPSQEPPPVSKRPKVLVIYSPAWKLHSECVHSLVNCMRYDLGLDMKFDADILNTTFQEPSLWCEQTFKECDYIIYIVSPKEIIGLEKAQTAFKGIEARQLHCLQSRFALKLNKKVCNIIFDHAEDGELPIETKNDRIFRIPKDWNKMVGFLLDMHVSGRAYVSSERYEILMKDLQRAKVMKG